MATKRRRRRRQRRDSAPGWVWMLFGLTLGLIVALVVYLRFGPPPALVEAGGSGVRAADGAAASSASPSGTPGSAERPDAATDASDAAGSGRRFDFYELLPRFEVVIPEVESSVESGVEPSLDSGGRPENAPRPVETPGRYVLQAGSFTRLEDADRMQASLALLGIESRIQRVTIDDATFHRVRVGPMDELSEVNRIRRRLREARVETLLMQVPQ